MKHRTQLEQAQVNLHMLPLPAADNTLAHTIDLLNEIVGQAQNGPPEGEADGSISEAQWYALYNLVKAVRAYLDAARAYIDAREAARIVESKR